MEMEAETDRLGQRLQEKENELQKLRSTINSLKNQVTEVSKDTDSEVKHEINKLSA